MDDWARAEPKLQDLFFALENNAVPWDRFHERHCESPLPRAYQFADGSAYVNHVELVRKARGARRCRRIVLDRSADVPGRLRPLRLGPRDPIVLADEAYGIDFEAEVCVDHRRRADGRRSAESRRSKHMPLADAGQRRLAARPDPGRARQGLRLLPGRSRLFRLLAGRRSRRTSSEDHWLGGKVLHPLISVS